MHYRQPEALAALLDSIKRQRVRAEVLVANASPEIRLSPTDGVRVLPVANRGYAASLNALAAEACGEMLVFCNADVVLRPGCLRRLFEHLHAHDDVGVVAPLLLNPDGTPQHNARRFYTWRTAAWARFPLRDLLPMPGFFKRYLMMDEPLEDAREVDWAMGAILVARRRALGDPAAPFDRRYSFYMEDVDFCLDMWQRGWRVVQVCDASAFHHHARASKRVISRPGARHFASFVRFVVKQRGLPERLG